MNLFDKIKPKFWHIKAATRDDRILFDYRRVWFVSILLFIVISLFPLIMFLIFNFNLAYRAIKNENQLRAARITSNTRRALTFFLEERLDALRFIAQGKSIEALMNDNELGYLLQNLHMGFGGYIDIGLIDASGLQINYAGPFDLKGKNYSVQDWFRKCVDDGHFISDVFLGYRQEPHMIIARKWPMENGSFYILRTTLDIRQFIKVLSSLDLSMESDAFLCNTDGILQTPSRYYGEVLKKIHLPVPPYSPRTQVLEAVDQAGNRILIGYAYIENSPFILMLVKRSKDILKGWYSLREKMIVLFIGSAVAILIVIYGMSTFMLNKVYDSDQTRLQAMARLESSSRLISLGRLAAGVAHEINNPLAVINENAGLIKDLFELKDEFKGDQQLMELIDTVLESVERSGEITRQLLGFARHFEPRITPLQLSQVISEVLSFLRKEALYRNIDIHIHIPGDFPAIHSDHGSLQQIFLNLINNAFQAMEDGGRLRIIAKKQPDERVSISISDTGHGISTDDQKKIFEPFFTTKDHKGGTGLGLSITYGLIRKLKGRISVDSKIGEGTTFVVTFPIHYEGEFKHEGAAR
jgi:signal transduction histidine kinase